MVKFYSGLMFVVVLLSSVILGTSQMSFFSSWVMLELNMLAFLGVISLTPTSAPSSSMKYFMAQSLGSSILLFGLAMVSFIDSSMVSYSIITLSLILKLGVAPLHGWFISFMSGLDWGIFFISSTIQKVLPVYLICLLQTEMLTLVVAASAVVGVIGSVGQMGAKKLLAYSSVFSGAWVLSCQLNFEVSVGYLLVYAFSLLGLVVYSMEDEENFNISSSSLGGPASALILLVALLNLGGTPPFIGFFAKISVVSLMVTTEETLMLGSLVAGSMFLLYVYLRVFISVLTAGGPHNLLQISLLGRVGGWGVVLIALTPIILCWLRSGVGH